MIQNSPISLQSLAKKFKPFILYLKLFLEADGEGFQLLCFVFLNYLMMMMVLLMEVV